MRREMCAPRHHPSNLDANPNPILNPNSNCTPTLPPNSNNNSNPNSNPNPKQVRAKRKVLIGQSEGLIDRCEPPVMRYCSDVHVPVLGM